MALRPDADVTVNGWRNESGGTTLYASLNETTANDATYIQSSDNPTDESFEVGLSNPTGTPTNGPFKYRIFKKFNNAAVVNMKVALMQGSTEIASWTHNDISSTPTEYSQTLTGPQFSAITDFTDLRIRGTANPAAAGPGLGSKTWDYWEPNSLVGMYQTDDTSTPVTVADGTQRVGRIVGKANSLAFVQADSTKRPYLATGGWLDFGDGQYYLNIDYPTATNTDRIGAGAVFNMKTGSSSWTDFVLWANDLGSGAQYETYDSIGILVGEGGGYIAGRKNGTQLGTVAISKDTRHRAISIFAPTAQRLSMDGGAYTGPDAATINLPTGSHGAFVGQTAHLYWGGTRSGFNTPAPAWWGKGGALVIFNDDLTSGEQTSLDTYLSSWNP